MKSLGKLLHKGKSFYRDHKVAAVAILAALAGILFPVLTGCAIGGLLAYLGVRFFTPEKDSDIIDAEYEDVNEKKND